MSGYGADADLRRSQESGFFTHLTKPVDIRGAGSRHRRRATLGEAAAGGVKAAAGAAPFRPGK